MASNSVAHRDNKLRYSRQNNVQYSEAFSVCFPVAVLEMYATRKLTDILIVTDQVSWLISDRNCMFTVALLLQELIDSRLW